MSKWWQSGFMCEERGCRRDANWEHPTHRTARALTPHWICGFHYAHYAKAMMVTTAFPWVYVGRPENEYGESADYFDYPHLGAIK